MKNQFKIIASVPTHHNSGDLRSAFNMPVKKYMNGVHEAYEEFETMEEAKDYLISRLDSYMNQSDMDDDKYSEELEEIEKYGRLTLCRITANIEEIEN